MAEIATADNLNDPEVNFDHLIGDLDARIDADIPVKEAKTDYDTLCKKQNERAGYHKKAMNWLTALNKMSDEKFEDCVRTLQPGLDFLVESRRQGGTPDMLDNVTSISK